MVARVLPQLLWAEVGLLETSRGTQRDVSKITGKGAGGPRPHRPAQPLAWERSSCQALMASALPSTTGSECYVRSGLRGHRANCLNGKCPLSTRKERLQVQCGPSSTALLSVSRHTSLF